MTFDQTQRLQYIHKGYSVFIQTDKAIYRPGDVVRFRAVVVTPQLKPSVVGSLDVEMTDGGGNVVRRWVNNKNVFICQNVTQKEGSHTKSSSFYVFSHRIAFSPLKAFSLPKSSLLNPSFMGRGTLAWTLVVKFLANPSK